MVLIVELKKNTNNCVKVLIVELKKKHKQLCYGAYC